MTTRRPSRPRSAARPARLWRTLTIGLAAVLALAGCMKIDYTATLHSDDTVSWTMVMATSDALAQQMGMDPKDLWQSVGADSTSDLPDGTTVEDYTQDGYTGVRMTAENQPLSAASGTDGALTFTREGDEFVVSGNLDLTDTSSELDTADPQTQAMLDSFQVRFAVTFPGPVSENNGTLDGTTVTWSPKYGESLQVSARGSAVGDGAAPSPTASASGSASASASESESAAPSQSTGEESEPAGDDVTAQSPEASSSGVPTWLLLLVGALLVAGVAVAVVLVLRQRGAAQRAAVAGAPGDLPPWQGPGAPVPPAPGVEQQGFGAPVPPPAFEDQPTAPLTPPPPPPPAPASEPPAPPRADEPGSTPPPPPPA